MNSDEFSCRGEEWESKAIESYAREHIHTVCMVVRGRIRKGVLVGIEHGEKWCVMLEVRGDDGVQIYCQGH